MRPTPVQWLLADGCQYQQTFRSALAGRGGVVGAKKYLSHSQVFENNQPTRSSLRRSSFKKAPIVISAGRFWDRTRSFARAYSYIKVTARGRSPHQTLYAISSGVLLTALQFCHDGATAGRTLRSSTSIFLHDQSFDISAPSSCLSSDRKITWRLMSSVKCGVERNVSL